MRLTYRLPDCDVLVQRPVNMVPGEALLGTNAYPVEPEIRPSRLRLCSLATIMRWYYHRPKKYLDI